MKSGFKTKWFSTRLILIQLLVVVKENFKDETTNSSEVLDENRQWIQEENREGSTGKFNS
jgi:hypothetical protein